MKRSRESVFGLGKIFETAFVLKDSITKALGVYPENTKNVISSFKGDLNRNEIENRINFVIQDVSLSIAHLEFDLEISFPFISLESKKICRVICIDYISKKKLRVITPIELEKIKSNSWNDEINDDNWWIFIIFSKESIMKELLSESRVKIRKIYWTSVVYELSREQSVHGKPSDSRFSFISWSKDTMKPFDDMYNLLLSNMSSINDTRNLSDEKFKQNRSKYYLLKDEYSLERDIILSQTRMDIMEYKKASEILDIFIEYSWKSHFIETIKKRIFFEVNANNFADNSNSGNSTSSSLEQFFNSSSSKKRSNDLKELLTRLESDQDDEKHNKVFIKLLNRPFTFNDVVISVNENITKGIRTGPLYNTGRVEFVKSSGVDSGYDWRCPISNCGLFSSDLSSDGYIFYNPEKNIKDNDDKIRKHASFVQVVLSNDNNNGSPRSVPKTLFEDTMSMLSLETTFGIDMSDNKEGILRISYPLLLLEIGSINKLSSETDGRWFTFNVKCGQRSFKSSNYTEDISDDKSKKNLPNQIDNELTLYTQMNILVKIHSSKIFEFKSLEKLRDFEEAGIVSFENNMCICNDVSFSENKCTDTSIVWMIIPKPHSKSYSDLISLIEEQSKIVKGGINNFKIRINFRRFSDSNNANVKKDMESDTESFSFIGTICFEFGALEIAIIYSSYILDNFYKKQANYISDTILKFGKINTVEEFVDEHTSIFEPFGSFDLNTSYDPINYTTLLLNLIISSFKLSYYTTTTATATATTTTTTTLTANTTTLSTYNTKDDWILQLNEGTRNSSYIIQQQIKKFFPINWIFWNWKMSDTNNTWITESSYISKLSHEETEKMSHVLTGQTPVTNLVSTVQDKVNSIVEKTKGFLIKGLELTNPQSIRIIGSPLINVLELITGVGFSSSDISTSFTDLNTTVLPVENSINRVIFLEKWKQFIRATESNPYKNTSENSNSNLRLLAITRITVLKQREKEYELIVSKKSNNEIDFVINNQLVKDIRKNLDLESMEDLRTYYYERNSINIAYMLSEQIPGSLYKLENGASLFV